MVSEINSNPVFVRGPTEKSFILRRQLILAINLVVCFSRSLSVIFRPIRATDSKEFNIWSGKLAIGRPFYFRKISLSSIPDGRPRPYEDTWLPCEKCVIRNPSCDDCKLMWTARRIDENNIQRARIHARVAGAISQT